jgi:hypothetical protein
MANIVKDFNKLTGTTHITSIPNRSQSNGIVERANKEVKRHLQALVLDIDITEAEWKRVAPLIQLIINNTKSSVTGYTPEQLYRGRNNDCLHPTLLAPITDENGVPMIDLGEELSLLQETQQELLKKSLEYQKTRQPKDEDDKETTQFKVGANVLALYPHGRVPRKHLTRWEGPFKVISQTGSVVTMKNYASEKIVTRHVTRVKLLHTHQGGMSENFLRKIAAKDKGEFIVDEIITHSGDINKLKNTTFQVKMVWIHHG